jgi:hypothetical protein
VDDTPLGLDFSERNYDANPRQPLPSIEPGGAIPPIEATGAGDRGVTPAQLSAFVRA